MVRDRIRAAVHRASSSGGIKPINDCFFCPCFHLITICALAYQQLLFKACGISVMFCTM